MDRNKIERVIRNIYLQSLGCKERDKVVLLTDDVWLANDQDNKEIFKLFKDTAKDLEILVKDCVYENVGRNGLEPPFSVWRLVLGENFIKSIDFQQIKNKDVDHNYLINLKNNIDVKLPDVIIALSYYSTSHTTFRKFLNSQGVRYASMPLLQESMFYTALDVDFDVLERETLEKKAQLENYSSLILTAPTGTEMYFEFGGREVNGDTGNLRKKGSFGNLPAGEVFFAPIENKSEGKFVVEYALNKKLNRPLEIFVRAGRVVNMKGDEDLKKYLEDLFEQNKSNAVIAELGIGTNRKAKDVLNVLEAEKIFNTCHIAIGDNSTFGGENKATVHMDFVIFNPTLRWS